MEGAAVKVTFVPAQMAPDGAAVTETPAVTVVFTTIVITFDVSCVELMQLALLVMMQRIWFPLPRTLLE